VIPWKMSKDERKQYDNIFRAWDKEGKGWIDGGVAKEVLGESGLDRNDLLQIW
jgi:actin cytoskeleton-regulatory complex protein PAN1